MSYKRGKTIMNAPRPDLLLLQSNSDMCTRLTALLSQYFRVHICNSTTEIFQTVEKTNCQVAVICKSFCNHPEIDWSQIIKKSSRKPVSKVFVCDGRSQNERAVAAACRRWSELYEATDGTTSTKISEIIEAAVHSLQVKGYWA